MMSFCIFLWSQVNFIALSAVLNATAVLVPFFSTNISNVVTCTRKSKTKYCIIFPEYFLAVLLLLSNECA